MVDKISDLLFHPKTLIKYKSTHFFKAFLFIFVLGFISYLVTFIDIARFDGYGIADKTDIEEMLDIDFSVVNNLPDCVLSEGTLTCDDPDTVTELGTGMRFFNFVIDPNENFKPSKASYYVIFTEDSIKYADGFSAINFDYDILPSKWQEFDFKEIKDSKYPEDALVLEFVSGYNEIIMKFIPIALVFVFFIGFMSLLIETLFVSFLFYLIFKKYNYTYRDVFKVTVFAQTFPVILGLIFDLLGMTTMTSFIITTLTFIYIYNALSPNNVIKQEK